MLTVFHTADWHLGQSFCGFDRDFEHSRFLDWLLEEMQSQNPNALIVAGDVFDTINPSAVAQKRLYNFLANAHATLPNLQIVLTAGNHDAGARLEAPAGLLDSLNISVIGTVRQDDAGNIDPEKFLVPLKDDAGQVQAIAMAVPFLRPSDVPLVNNAADPYLDGVRELYRRTMVAAHELRAKRNPNAALIALGHCHLHGGTESRDSERCLVIGGAEAIGSDTFDPRIAYVALGHLHKSQQFDGGRIRYSGSPIPLSFAEADYRHQIMKLTFENSELTFATEIIIPRAAMMLRIPAKGAAKIDDVLIELAAVKVQDGLPLEQHPFVEVQVIEDGPDPLRRRRIEQALEGKPLRLASIKLKSPERVRAASDAASEIPQTDLNSILPEVVFLDAWREKYRSEPDHRVLLAFRSILQQEARG